MSRPKGTSQTAVFDFIKGKTVTAQEVGDALYEKTCSNAEYLQYEFDKAKTKREWASKLLNNLARDGFIEKDATVKTKPKYARPINKAA